MKKSKTLVIGGGGFIGEYLVDNLKKNSIEVKIFDKDSTETLEKAVLDADQVVYLVRPDPIFLKRTLSALDHSQAKFFLYASTVLVYKGGQQLQNEENIVSPITQEGKNKRIEEEMVIDFREKNKNINVTIARLGNVYGGVKNRGLIGRVCDQLSRKSQGVIILPGDGSQTKDFVFVDDIAKALSMLVVNNITVDIVNISTGIGSSILGVINEIEKLSQMKVDYDFGPEVPEAHTLIADNSKLRSLLGWAPETYLEEGLRKTLQRCIII